MRSWHLPAGIPQVRFDIVAYGLRLYENRHKFTMMIDDTRAGRFG